MAQKRGFGQQDGSQVKRSRVVDEEFKDAKELRVLIDNNQVGAVIGKGGSNVKKAREELNAILSILKVENKNVPDRVLVIRARDAYLAAVVQFVAQNLLEASSRSKKRQNASGDESATIPMKFLVHKLSVGAIIGKGGAAIKDTQAQTGTIMQISKEPMPHSTEKTVTITGNPESIKAALEIVLSQLAAAPLKGSVETTPYNPGHQILYAPPPYMAPPSQSPYGVGSVGMGGMGGYGGYHPYGGSQVSGVSGSSASSATSTQKIAIPTSCVGCVIGKGGAVIRDLRAQSGTNISIAPPEASNPDERVVTVTGTPEGITAAVYLIRQLVEQQPLPAAHGHHMHPHAEY